jgi:DUF1680 family protein
LAGETLLEVDALEFAKGDWSNKLYRPAGRQPPDKITARLIPYYAWSNRGPSEMSVWLPRN